MDSGVMIRNATLDDLGALVNLEERVFQSDRFDSRRYKYLITRARASVLVMDYKKRLAGAAILLWHKKRSSARLYNIVIDPLYQGKGLGTSLLQGCEEAAAKRGYISITLEVRTDNADAITFYEKHGYRTLETVEDFYDDGSAAFRMIKRLDCARPARLHLKIPYYAQSLEFTCGAACLMMVMKYINPEMKLNRTLELSLWKEATLIYTTSGLGGTGPFGLALAARRRGFNVRVILAKEQTPFFSSVRDAGKREVIRLVHEDLKKQAIDAGVKADYYDFTFDEIAYELSQGKVPIVLISTYRLYGFRAPHWVVITGYDGKYIYFHDSYRKFHGGKQDLAKNVRIPIEEFRKMRTYGKDLHKSVIFISRKDSKSRKK
jgi:ribosomal protein S18 acetylase RimI-like enzyme